MDIRLTEKQTELWDVLFDDNCRLIQNEYTEFYSIGGFGSGKSRIINMAVNMLCVQYPRCHGVYIRGTFQELKDSVIPQFLEYEPREIYKYRYLKADRTCEYCNGTRLDFRAFDKDVKILSNEYDFVAFSQIEELIYDLFLQTLGRNRRRVGGLGKNIILAEGNPTIGWLKTRLKDKPLKPNMYLIESKTSDNKANLPPGYEDNLRENYPDFWIARYLDCEWSNLKEMVFSEFCEDRDVIDPIDFKYIESYKRRSGLDYGWINPTAIVWSYVDYDGNLTIFDEWGGSYKSTSEIAKEAFRYGKIIIVADYSIKKPDRDGRSVWDDLVKEHLNLEPSPKYELEMIVLINSLLKSGRLKVTRNCIKLIEEIKEYKWKNLKLGEQKSDPEKPIDRKNHWIKAAEYMIATIEEIKTPDPKVAQYKKTLKYATTRRQNRSLKMS